VKTQMTKIAAGLLLSAFAANALASETTGNLSVLAQIVGTCTVANASLYFGTYDTNNYPSSPGLVANTPINVTCTSGANYSVYLGPGAGSGATVLDRSMTGTVHSAALDYQLYIDSGYSQIWGDGTVGTYYNCGVGNGAAQPYTVYGQIPNSGSNPSAPIDSYTDTVLIEVFY
jgi:spore coat protein U-like protein